MSGLSFQDRLQVTPEKALQDLPPQPVEGPSEALHRYLYALDIRHFEFWPKKSKKTIKFL